MDTLLQRTRKGLAIIIVIAAGVHAVSAQGGNTIEVDLEKKAMVEAVKERSQQFYSDLQYDKGTLAKVMAFYDENHDIEWQTDPVMFIDNTFIIRNRTDLVEFWRNLFDRRITSKFTIDKSHYEVLSKDKVLEVIKGDFTNVRKDGSVAGPFTMVNTAIWIDRNGEWKIQYFHHSWGRKSE
jgi:hypothetical protein